MSAVDGSSLSSLSDEDPSTKENSLSKESPQHSAPLPSGQTEESSQADRLLSGEEQLTLITDSMSVTSADEEKLQLLNKNTELRRLNKELMKLNEDWDHIYRSTSLGLQQRVLTLEQECATIKQLNSRLLLKVEHEQSKREYYEHTLMQELKKSQRLQEYIRLLESRLHHTDSTAKDWPFGVQSPTDTIKPPELDAQEQKSKCSGEVRQGAMSSTAERHSRAKSSPGASAKDHDERTSTMREVQDLKEQLEALRCQTKIYEADFKTEHKDHEHVLQENKRLRRRESEMRQQMALLQEQLKVYEDDFQRERSDKQILQRLLMKKSPAVKDPVLVHRCNHEPDRVRGERRKHREEQKGAYAHHPLCPQHCEQADYS